MAKKRHIVIAVVVTFYVTTLFFLIAGARLYFMGLGNSKSFNEKIAKIEYLLSESFIFDYDKEKSEENALEGYLAACDDVYTEYISKAEFSSYKVASDGEYRGIGVVVSLNGDEVTVVSVNAESPASKAGIKPEDVIKKVNGVEVNAQSYNDVISIIRGQDERGKDDNLSIVISRKGKEISLTAKRELVQSVTVTEKILEGNIGYVRISSFEGKTGEQFEKAVNNLIDKNVKGFIFDVRNNPGGTLDAVLSVTDRVLEKGKILTIKGKNGIEEVFEADSDESISLPICVIANEGSASAAEVFTAALKENGVAKVVGTTTFGKGIVQTIHDLGDETAVKLTTAKYYTPSGECIHEIGVKPDYEVELAKMYRETSVSDIPYDADLQLKKAIEMINN